MNNDVDENDFVSAPSSIVDGKQYFTVFRCTKACDLAQVLARSTNQRTALRESGCFVEVPAPQAVYRSSGTNFFLPFPGDD